MSKSVRRIPLTLAFAADVITFCVLAAELFLNSSTLFILATVGVLVVSVAMTVVLLITGGMNFRTAKMPKLEEMEPVKDEEEKKNEKKYTKKFSGIMGDYVLLRYISQAMEKSVKEDIPRAMIYLHPTTYSRFYSTIFLIVLAVALPIGVILFILTKNPLTLMLILSPLIFVMLPLIEVKIKISNRKSDTANEFPFFMVYAATLQAAGLSLYTALDRMTDWRILPKIKREAMVVKRDYMFFSHNPLLALENVAKDHPDENLKTIFLGYTSVLRSGGDLMIYLNSKVRDGLNTVIDRWKRYADSASTLGEVSLSVFLMFPSLLIAMSIAFASGYSVTMMQLYGYAVLPLLGGFMIMGVHISQPKFYDIYNLNKAFIISVIAAVAFGAATYFFLQPFSYWLAATLLVFSVLMGTEFIREQSDVGKVEKALPFFLRDITEMLKIGYDINQTLINLPKQRQYNKTFDLFLKRVSEHLEMNMPLRRVAETMTVRSWLCRYTFFILSEVVDTGGGTPEVLESLTGFVNGVVVEKNKAKSTTRTYSFLGYATPAFLSAVMVFMTNMLFPSLGNLTMGPTQLTILPTAAGLALISSTAMIVVVLTAFIVGLLIAKIVDMSIYATYHSAISLAICLISFVFIK